MGRLPVLTKNKWGKTSASPPLPQITKGYVFKASTKCWVYSHEKTQHNVKGTYLKIPENGKVHSSSLLSPRNYFSRNASIWCSH